MAIPDALLALAERDIAAGAREADVVETLVQNGHDPADATAVVRRLARARRGSGLASAALVVLLAAGVVWAALPPVPDWRLTAHAVVLAVSAGGVAAVAVVSRRFRLRASATAGGLGVLAAVAWAANTDPTGVCATSARSEGEVVHVEEWCRMGLLDGAVDCRWTHHHVVLGWFLGPALADQRCACG